MKPVEFSEFDTQCMKQALQIAQRNKKKVSPNPQVGAVIAKNGKIITKGAHLKFGGPHAEINAIRKAGTKTKGATIYVTLEPCSHFGKTPPCVDAILKAGFKKVVYAMSDPNPLVKKQNGIDKLLANGIEVQSGLLQQEAERINQAFIKWNQKKTPYCIAKWAMTLDGAIADGQGNSKWISSVEARKYTHQLRAKVDAVMVGANTFLKDNPSLTIRLKQSYEQPFRITFLDEIKNAYFQSNFFKIKDGKTILFCRKPPTKSIAKKLLEAKVQIFTSKKSIKLSLKALENHPIQKILIEGGSHFHGQCLNEGLIDYLHCFVGNKILLSQGIPPITNFKKNKMNQSKSLIRPSIKPLGDSICIEGFFNVYGVKK